jgi:hypothetical protein
LGEDEEKLCEQFFSFNYSQILYKSLLNIKQVGSTEEYTNLFYQLISRVDLNENKQQKTKNKQPFVDRTT